MMYSSQPTGSSDTEQIFTDMKWRPSLLFFSFLGIAGIVFFLNRLAPFQNGDPNPEREAKLIHAILYGLDRYHFQPKAIDDKLSEQVYDLYLQNIDGGKRFFTQADIAKFKPFEKQLDDQAREGTFEFFNTSIEHLEQSLTKTQGWYREILAAPMDFSKDESFETDGKKLNWAKNDADCAVAGKNG